MPGGNNDILSVIQNGVQAVRNYGNNINSILGALIAQVVTLQGQAHRLKFIVLPTDYGADPTGNNDSAAAFQAAIDSFGEGNGTVFVPVGTYNIGSTITLRTSINLIGEGALDWADVSHRPVSELKWTGAANGTMLYLGNVYTGRVFGLTLNGNDIASCGFDMGAPESSIFEQITVHSCVTGGGGGGIPDAAMRAYCMGQHYPDDPLLQIPSALSGCQLNNICVIGTSGQVCFAGQGITDCQWNMPVMECFDPGGFCVTLTGDPALPGGDSDTTSWFNVFFTAWGGSTAVFIDDAGYGNNFYGGAVNNGDAPSVCFDVRNGAPGTCNYCFGMFNGPFIPLSTVTTAGATPGFIQFIGTSWGIQNTSTLTVGPSPWTYNNSDNYYQVELIINNSATLNSVTFVRQGNTNVIGVNDVTTNPFSITLDVGDSVIIDYTDVPNVLLIPH